MDGINIVGVQFRRAGRIYDFAAGGVNLKVGDDVVVDTERGPSLAKVAVVRFGSGAEARDKEIKPIIRLASRRDVDDTRVLSPEAAVSFARERCDRLKLKMTVLQADVQFGGNKVIVYFSAPGRVDFRELVKDLATGLKARVELKQVGARDEAKLVGGLGICGREFCCSSFLREFVPVSIKMAKNQNLALNPSKVSGGCGRLLCCLTYENDLYTELRRKLPPRGTRVRSLADDVMGDVLKGDVLNQVVMIETDEGRLVVVPIKDMEIVERSRAAPAVETEAEAWGEDIDIAALTGLEDDSAGPRPPRGDNAGPRPPRDKDRGERGPRPAGGRPDAPRGRGGERPPGGGGRPEAQGRGDRPSGGGRPPRAGGDAPQAPSGPASAPRGGAPGDARRDGTPRPEGQGQGQAQGKGEGKSRGRDRGRGRDRNKPDRPGDGGGGGGTGGAGPSSAPASSGPDQDKKGGGDGSGGEQS